MKYLKSRKSVLLLLALLLIGLGVRIFGAWRSQFSPNSDYGIVGLMAKHMAEGREFPTFFYGQAYMGSVEPVVSAVMVKCFGFSGFSVCLGTALFAFCLLPIVYLWGRDSGDRGSGVAALLYMLIGPSFFFNYAGAPRGGYMSALALGSLVLWLASRTGAALAKGDPISWRAYAVLGLAGGLGWWANQLVVVYLLPAAALLAACMRFRVFTRGVLVSLLFFILGSLPWWLWSIHHNWETLAFGGSIGGVDMGQGLVESGRLLPDVIIVSGLPTLIHYAQIVAAAFLFVVFLCSLATEIRRRAWRGPLVYMAGLLMMLGCMFALFSVSHYGSMKSARYLLPITPVSAVIFGMGTGYLRSKTKHGVCWLPLGLLLLCQLYLLPRALGRVEQETHAWDRASLLEQAANDHELGALYGGYRYSWINMATSERLCVCGLKEERYAPYALRAASSGSYGILNNDFQLAKFLDETGGGTTRTALDGFTIDHDFIPPAPVAVHPGSIVKTVSDEAGNDWTSTLTDDDLDTAWVEDIRDEPRSLEWQFTKPTLISGLRIFNQGEWHYPGHCIIEGRVSEASQWETLLNASSFNMYFWSGPRLFWNGLQYFKEYRFALRRLTALRITFRKKRVYTCNLGEVHFLRPLEPAGKSPELASTLLAELRARSVASLYAPRWVSEALYRDRTGADDIELFLPSAYDAGQVCFDAGDPTLPYVRLSKHTGFLVAPEDAPQTEACLILRAVPFVSESIGDWTLFRVDAQAWDSTRHARYPALYWTERGCLLGSHSGAAKRSAHEWYGMASQAELRGEARNKVFTLLRQAVQAHPSHAPAVEMMQGVAVTAEQKAVAEQASDRLQALVTPDQATEILFKGGIRLLGLTPASQTVARGEAFRIKYYWHLPAGPKRLDHDVFVHFRNGDERFQDDHSLYKSISRSDLEFQPYSDTFVLERQVRAPLDIPPGTYSVRVGIVARDRRARLSARSKLKTTRDAVYLPVTVNIKD